MAASRPQWAEDLEPGIRQWIADGYDMLTPTYPSLLKTFTSDRQFEEDMDSTGIGYLSDTEEGGPTQYEDPLQGYKTRYTHKTFRKGVQVTLEEYEDDLYRVFQNRTTMLGKAGKRTYDVYAMDLFRGAFNTARTSYGDTKPLASTAHTRVDGGANQSNASSTGIPLNEPNLNTAALAMMKILDNKGQLVAVGEGKKTLVVPLDLDKKATEITESVLKSDSANNDLNYYLGGKFDVMSTRWIGAEATLLDTGSATAWFLLSQTDYKLNFFMRVPFSVTDDYDFDRDILKNKGRTRFSYGWSDWRGFWGSKGDGAAYSS